MDKRELLKSMLTNFIHDKNEEAHTDIHNYLTAKFQEVSGVQSPQSFSTSHNGTDMDLDDFDSIDHDGTDTDLDDFDFDSKHN